MVVWLAIVIKKNISITNSYKLVCDILNSTIISPYIR